MPDPSIDRLTHFIDASPTPYHCVRSVTTVLDSHGFKPLDLGAEPQPLPAGYRGYVVQGGAVFAFQVGAQPVVEAGFRMVAAHTDSPNLRIKPQPVLRDKGWVRLGVERYGGAILPTWADRDLGVAGKVILRRDGRTHKQLIDLRRPLCRVPTLAIHLDRTVNDKGLKLNPQTEMPVLFALDDGGPDPLRALLAAELDCAQDDVLTWDLSLYDLAPAAISGADSAFLHASRLDDQACCHAGLEAMLASMEGDLPPTTAVLALFDHEEIGSTTARGADSRTLDNVLRRILRDGELDAPGTYSRALHHSMLVSADMAHAVHPAHPEAHDSEHMPRLNQGPVIKQNAQKRYATEAETAAKFMLLAERVEVPLQWYVHRADRPCGSTVGPMLASRLGVRTLDIGNAMLSMHSIRELCGTRDHPWMISLLAEFYRGAPM